MPRYHLNQGDLNYETLPHHYSPVAEVFCQTWFEDNCTIEET